MSKLIHVAFKPFIQHRELLIKNYVKYSYNYSSKTIYYKERYVTS